MENFDLNKILSQQQLAKKKLDKILKELAFHNNRNALNGFPIEFMEQYSARDKDTLILILQCNKSVSADISSYLSAASDERRRSNVNPAADKVDGKKKVNSPEEEKADQPKTKDVEDVKNEESNKVDTKQQNDEEMANSNGKEEQTADEMKLDEANVATNENESTPQRAEATSYEESKGSIVSDDDKIFQDASKDHDQIDKSSSKNVDSTSEKENTKADEVNELDTMQADATVLNDNATTEESRDVSKTSGTKVTEDTTSNEIEENVTKTSENDNSDERNNTEEASKAVHIEEEMEHSMEQEEDETQTSKPKKLMTRIAEEAAGIVERRGLLHVEDNKDGEKGKTDEEELIVQKDVNNSNEETKDANEKSGKKKKLVLKKKKATDTKKEIIEPEMSDELSEITDISSDEDEIEEKESIELAKQSIDPVKVPTETTTTEKGQEEEATQSKEEGMSKESDQADNMEVSSPEVDKTEEENTKVDESRISPFDETEKEDPQKDVRSINGEIEYQRLHRGDNKESEDYELRKFEGSEYEEKHFDDIRTIDHKSSRISKTQIYNDEYAEEIVELTDAERAYINKAKTFHGRQCRRRRIRRIREEEGEYLDTNEVISRIRQKTEALLERQHKLMKRSACY